VKTLEQSAIEARAVRMLRALANPVRYRAVQILAERKEATSAALADDLPLAPSSLFEHLGTLRDAGLIHTTGDGPKALYTLDPAALDFLAGVLGGLGQRARSWHEVAAALSDGARAGAAPAATRPTEERMQIRDATDADAAAIARIYNQGIEDRVATLETQTRTPAERLEWMRSKGPRHPVLVAENGAGEVVGWASLNSFNPRPAYDHVVDFSVYVGRDQRGKGIGDALLGALEGRARAIGYHKMVLAAFPTNAAGMRLYERHGFRTVGIYREQGMLDGTWVDVIVMEKILG
jgi:L-amino acid N-acyltransferase YncA/DNA-binding transcriptional ArsR family regulator